jgi:hypothetical protein
MTWDMTQLKRAYSRAERKPRLLCNVLARSTSQEADAAAEKRNDAARSRSFDGPQGAE